MIVHHTLYTTDLALKGLRPISNNGTEKLRKVTRLYTTDLALKGLFVVVIYFPGVETTRLLGLVVEVYD